MVRAVAVVLVLGLSVGARAEGSLAGPLYDLPAPRAVALGGAERASGVSNDAIWLNPAALGDAQRYTVTFDGAYDLRGGGVGAAGLSVVDSTTAPVGAGLAAHRVWLGSGGGVANVFDLALATQLGDLVTLGATGKLIHTRDGAGSHNRLAPDVGLFVKASPVQLGLVAYNLANPDPVLAPRQYALAASVNLPRLPRLEGDVVLDPSTNADVSVAYHLGAEYELLPMLALRAGYLEDRIRGQRAVSGGIGFFVPPGFGLDVSYRHELLGAQPERLVVVGINLGM